MKLVFILHHHHATFATDISKIYSPQEYRLYGMFNNTSYQPLAERKQQDLFTGIHLSEDYSFETLKAYVEKVLQENADVTDIEFVTGAEHDMVVCGRLRQHFFKKLYERDVENYDRFNDKLEMKKKLANSNIKLPKYMAFDKEAYRENPTAYLEAIKARIPFPMFMKPINQNGSIGTDKIMDEEHLARWAATVCRNDNTMEYEIDEFINGTLFHIDTFWKNGKPVYSQVSEDLNPCYDFMLGKPEGSIVLDKQDPDDAPIHEALSRFAEDALNKMGAPQHGITHMEAFLQPDGALVFLEVAYRPGGAAIPKMYQEYLGRDIRTDHILLQIKPDHLDPDRGAEIKRVGDIAAWVSFPLQKGTVAECKEPPVASPSRSTTWKIQKGDTVTADNKSITDEACHIFFHSHDRATVRADFNLLRTFQPLTMHTPTVASSHVSQLTLMSRYETMCSSKLLGGSGDIVFPALSLDAPRQDNTSMTSATTTTALSTDTATASNETQANSASDIGRTTLKRSYSQTALGSSK